MTNRAEVAFDPQRGPSLPGDDPEGFMPRDEVVDDIERYAKMFRPPVLEGVTVTLSVPANPACRSWRNICQRIDDYISAQQIEAPEESRPVPAWVPESEPTELNFAANNITAIIWCLGFLPDFPD